MSKTIKLTVMKPNGENKKLEQDGEGYYKISLGAFNIDNSKGDIYLFDGVDAILKNKESILNRRLLTGRLRSETEHPTMMPGMSERDFVFRYLEIPMTSVCAHIKEVMFKFTDEYRCTWCW